jgi:hypothetical protein
LPDKEKQGVCVSLEEWAVQILQPSISRVLDCAMTDSKTETRFERANNQKLLKSQRRTTR